jgi:hypothetical protein
VQHHGTRAIATDATISLVDDHVHVMGVAGAHDGASVVEVVVLMARQKVPRVDAVLAIKGAHYHNVAVEQWVMACTERERERGERGERVVRERGVRASGGQVSLSLSLPASPAAYSPA